MSPFDHKLLDIRMSPFGHLIAKLFFHITFILKPHGQLLVSLLLLSRLLPDNPIVTTINDMATEVFVNSVTNKVIVQSNAYLQRVFLVPHLLLTAPPQTLPLDNLGSWILLPQIMSPLIFTTFPFTHPMMVLIQYSLVMVQVCVSLILVPLHFLPSLSLMFYVFLQFKKIWCLFLNFANNI